MRDGFDVVEPVFKRCGLRKGVSHVGMPARDQNLRTGHFHDFYDVRIEVYAHASY